MEKISISTLQQPLRLLVLRTAGKLLFIVFSSCKLPVFLTSVGDWSGQLGGVPRHGQQEAGQRGAAARGGGHSPGRAGYQCFLIHNVFIYLHIFFNNHSFS